MEETKKFGTAKELGKLDVIEENLIQQNTFYQQSKWPIHRVLYTKPVTGKDFEVDDKGKVVWYSIKNGIIFRHKNNAEKKNGTRLIQAMSCFIPKSNNHLYPIKKAADDTVKCFIMTNKLLLHGISLVYDKDVLFKFPENGKNIEYKHISIIATKEMDAMEYIELISQIQWIPCTIVANGLVETLICPDDDDYDFDYEISEGFYLMKYIYDTSPCYMTQMKAFDVHSYLSIKKPSFLELVTNSYAYMVYELLCNLDIIWDSVTIQTYRSDLLCRLENELKIDSEIKTEVRII